MFIDGPTNGVIGNPLETVQGQTLLNSSNVSTTNLLLVDGEGVGSCQTVVNALLLCVLHSVWYSCSFVDDTSNFPC